MITTFIAFLLLIIFFAYFIRIKFTSVKKKSLDDVSDSKSQDEDITNDNISPLNIARLKQIKLAFFAFADFVLIEKRPFTVDLKIKDQLEIDVQDALLVQNDLLSSQGSQEYIAQSTFDNDASVKTSTFSNIVTPDKCYDKCKHDPLGKCNLWTFTSSSDGGQTSNKCTNEVITQLPVVSKKSDGESFNSGYIRRSKDLWAIKDESGLPTNKEFFKSIASLVIKLGGAPRTLRERASNVLSNYNVKYCYRKEPLTSLDDSILKKYIETKEDCIKEFENVCQYFFFMDENDLSDSPEFIEYAVLCARILSPFKSETGKVIFPNKHSSPKCDKNEVFSEEFCEEVVMIYLFFITYSEQKESLREIFYNNDVNVDYDGFLSKDELINYMYKNAVVQKATENPNLNFADKEKMYGEDCKELLEKVTREVNRIFFVADKNNDGKLSFSEFEESYQDMILKNKPSRPKKHCKEKSMWSYEIDSAEYDPNTALIFDEEKEVRILAKSGCEKIPFNKLYDSSSKCKNYYKIDTNQNGEKVKYKCIAQNSGTGCGGSTEIFKGVDNYEQILNVGKESYTNEEF